MSEVRGSRPECQATFLLAKDQLRVATLCPRSGAAAERSYPVSEVRGGGREELPHVRGQWRPGEATQHLMPVVASRRHPASEARGGDPEEPPQARGQGRQGREEQPQEWWLRRYRRA